MRENAATVIQSVYRGYTVRRRWAAILATHNSPELARHALRLEGLSTEAAASLVERYWRPSRPHMADVVSAGTNHSRDRHSDLNPFAQHVSTMLYYFATNQTKYMLIQTYFII